MKEVVKVWRRNRVVMGRRLRNLREDAGLTQLALAEKSGVSNDTISRIEHGVRAPQAATILELTRALNIHPQDLLISRPDQLSSY